MQTGSARVRPRPMNFIRSVSKDTSPIVVPWTVIRCIIHGGFSSAERGLREDRLVAFPRLERRLPGGGPEDAAVQIAQIAERAEAIAGGVFAPARHGQITPSAVTAAGAGDHDVVSAVGKQMHLGRRPVR